jgi:hypothetical protein
LDLLLWFCRIVLDRGKVWRRETLKALVRVVVIEREKFTCLNSISGVNIGRKL